jgi:hypothetical protein
MHSSLFFGGFGNPLTKNRSRLFFTKETNFLKCVTFNDVKYLETSAEWKFNKLVLDCTPTVEIREQSFKENSGKAL